MYTWLSQLQNKYIPDFDSSSSMLYSLGNYLADKKDAMGLIPMLPSGVGDMINLIPRPTLKLIFKIGGAMESISLRRLAEVDDRVISNWIIKAYPEKKYPAVVIGSPNGALIHLCAALGIPWIPQTVLLAPSRKIGVDDLVGDMEWGKKAVRVMKKKLGYFRFHQMHDPIHDRIMVSNMGYFRMKRLKLGPYLEDYLKQILMPDAMIFIADCAYRWPAHKITDQHYFQVGGLGDVSGNEYLKGSPRIARFLKDQGTGLKQWEVPHGQADIPEAEWGFAGELADDIYSFAKKNSWRQVHIRFDHPEDASPFCADLVRWWHEKNGIRDKRLLLECFAFIMPWWAPKTGSIPFWLAFNTSRSLRAFEKYARRHSRFDEMYAMIMPNAVQSIGLVPIREWKKLMRRYAKKSFLIGTDERIYPYDMGTFIKYFRDAQQKIKARHFMPRYLELGEFFGYIRKNKGRYDISFSDIR